MPVYRFDSYKIDGFREHPSGHLILDLRMARIGIQEYSQGDGTIRREMRSEEEVFSADAMNSFKGVPVTFLHPPEMITDQNTRDFIIGHIGDDLRRDGDWLRGSAKVWDPDVKKKIVNKEIREVSNGYFADFDDSPGIFNDKKFDGYQRNIVGNHTALGPYGWARAGRGARIMLDSIGNAYLPVHAKKTDQEKSMEITIDGITYKVDGDANALAQAIKKALESRDAKIADFEVTSKKADGKIQGELDASVAENKKLKGEIAELNKRVDSLEDPAYLKEKVSERSKLLEKAREIAGKDFDCDGSDLEVKIEALKKAGNELPDFEGKSDDYRDAYLDSLWDRAKKAEPKKGDSKISKIITSDSNEKSAVNDAIDRAFNARFGKEA